MFCLLEIPKMDLEVKLERKWILDLKWDSANVL